MKKQRPVNLDLTTVKFPASAIASILHRVTGVAMFIAMGILMWVLAASLSSQTGFEQVHQWSQSIWGKFIYWGTLTALGYHVLAGLRHLVMDLGHWENLESGNLSAKIVVVLAVVLSVIAGVWVW
ncbi:succinate dehydrogenase, cytochrome b556 subunit [Gayadomonas joobiniege]|uniref:succinate dehydrogenase, cytochrome b556 subunit n=1 Tax=Gayadomonas joobiniege TaxID=1234606 RepID=UPI00037F4A5A|nr:succinate dehydrogenase, cytochrome b556 subunit [Gayadomonas joobiniege]